MNKYQCFYNGLECEIEANSSYQAQQRAAAHMSVRKNKQYLITVVLCEKDGEEVIHSTASL